MTAKKTGAELAEYYNATGDISEFEGAEPFDLRRSVTMSVRSSADDVDALRRRADVPTCRHCRTEGDRVHS